MSAAEPVTVQRDPAFNDPAPTVIDGREYTIREIKYRQLRPLGLGFVQFLLGLNDGTKSMDQLIDAQLDKFSQFAADSTGLGVAELEDFGASHTLRLFNAVFEVHRPVLNEIFLMRRQFESLAPRKNGTGSESPSSSSP